MGDVLPDGKLELAAAARIVAQVFELDERLILTGHFLSKPGFLLVEPVDDGMGVSGDLVVQ